MDWVAGQRRVTSVVCRACRIAISFDPLSWWPFWQQHYPGETVRRWYKPAPASPPALLAKIDEIEAEMKGIGVWRDPPGSPDSLTGWLQIVFILRLRKMLAEGSELPATCRLRGVREGEGEDTGLKRLEILCAEFDALFRLREEEGKEGLFRKLRRALRFGRLS